MSKNTGIIITLAYPETIVMVADEWYSPFLKYIGIGKKKYLRAGHAALVLINKNNGELEYFDFGRYITSEPNGRVRGGKYDRELRIPLKAKITNGKIQNLKEILMFLGSNPQLTHGEGELIASVCYKIDYNRAKNYIEKMQRFGSIRYAAFKKKASNCARFVADVLVASVNDLRIFRRQEQSRFPRAGRRVGGGSFVPGRCTHVVTARFELYTDAERVPDHGVFERVANLGDAANKTHG